MSKGESSSAQLSQHLLNAHRQQSRISDAQPQEFQEIMLQNEMTRLDNLDLNMGNQGHFRAELPMHQQQPARPMGIAFSEMETIFTQSQQSLQGESSLVNNSDWAREFGGNQQRVAFPRFSQPSMYGNVGMNRPIIASNNEMESATANIEWQKEFAKRMNEQLAQASIEPLNQQKGKQRDWESEFQDIWNNLKLDKEDNKLFEEFHKEHEIEWNDNINPFKLDSIPYDFEPENQNLAHDNPYLLGLQILQDHGSLSLAALAFEAAVQKDDSNSDAWLQLGKVQAENEKELPAISALQKSVETNPLNVEGLLSLAVSYINEGMTDQAHTSLNKWLQTSFPQLNVPTFETNAHDNLCKYYLMAIQNDAKTEQVNADLQLGLGLLFYNVGEYDKTVDCFTCALSTRVDDYLLWNRLGATLSNSGKSNYF